MFFGNTTLHLVNFSPLYADDLHLKNTKTTTNGVDWNSMLGLLVRLKQDKNYRTYLLIATGCYFGLRIGDLLNLKWMDVFEKDEFILTEQKTGKQRKITINAFIKETVSFVAAAETAAGKFDIHGYLFSNRQGNKITVQYANLLLHEVFTKYNVRVQNGSTHTLRKTFGKRVWDSDGKSERALVYLSEIFSHSSIATTKKYIGITEKVIADVYLKM
ncbi:MAG TPA: tyrosine-type recombinase/integrase [Bacteroidia bacterium]|nr:tyrosine-type recombinase/integrase [Bacteroidia bacterium]